MPHPTCSRRLDLLQSEFDDDGIGTAASISDGLFDLIATIDAAGNLSAGTLSIMGDLGSGLQTLLTGDLTAFGFPDPGDGDFLQFGFDVTGGSLAGLYGDSGGTMLWFAGFSGSFASDFTNDSWGFGGMGVSDTKSVPEPATMLLMLAGLGGLFAFRKYLPLNSN